MVLVEDAPSVAPPRRRSRRKIVVLAVVVLLAVAGGAVAATAIAFRYLHAQKIEMFGGGWIGADRGHTRSIRLGGISGSVVAPRPGHSQSFTIEVGNFSSVTQTVLGMTDARSAGDPSEKDEPEHLAVSTQSTFPHRGRVRFTSKPVVMPPHTQYRMRFTHDTSDIWDGGCRSEWWDQISLQVKVGVFTRTEVVDFTRFVFEMRSEDC